MSVAAKPNVVVLTLGGTISMAAPGAGGGMVPKLSATDILGSVPALERVATITPVSYMQVPGATLTIDDIRGLASRLNREFEGDTDGAVVVQGTDTIEETAYLLDLLVASDKPVAVTGAMRGAEQLGPDGPANLFASIVVAASQQSRGRGTLVVLNDEIHAARSVVKAHTLLPSAFQSPSRGVVGIVAEGSPVFFDNAPKNRQTIVPGDIDAPVALVTITLGEDDRLLRSLNGLNYKGVVLEAMGAGHVPARLVPAIEDLLRSVPVVLGTRVLGGPVAQRTYGFPGSEMDLLSRGVLHGGFLNTLKARLLLSLLLTNGQSREELSLQWKRHTAV